MSVHLLLWKMCAISAPHATAGSSVRSRSRDPTVSLDHPFSPLKSEFAFDKLVSTPIVAKLKYTSLCRKNRIHDIRTGSAMHADAAVSTRPSWTFGRSGGSGWNLLDCLVSESPLSPTCTRINQILRLGLLPKHANISRGMRKNRCLGAVRGVRCI